jgi:lipopolysaccharide/colanic/teichoic acid biosynthesis glycosyltransferase
LWVHSAIDLVFPYTVCGNFGETFLILKFRTTGSSENH